MTTLAKRAAYRCSNPDCGATTSGPAACRTSSVNVGEAAHIYGANPGSARFDAQMTSAERADITNAIWLCSNCHKLVDDDPLRYPAGLLFEWQKDHESVVSAQIGKAGAVVRQRYERRHLEEFGKLSYLSERIILEKGDLWEYRLTCEVLRYEMGPVTQRWSALQRGLYTRALTKIPEEEFMSWIHMKFSEMMKIIHSLSTLANFEFVRAWGEAGVPGDDKAIVATCRLVAEACSRALAWEESVRFCVVDNLFEKCQGLLFGIVGRVIDEMSKVSSFMNDIFCKDDLSGQHHLSLVFDLPNGWENTFNEELKVLENKIIKNNR
ncbi:HNH endonuclease [Komagataeibacter rhaeticus]|uniref:HNH endonuclease n=1 Tax=Komagataeibacter rhaeticus TaxID=215221 RepID=A0A858JL48_9PROT|nr:HNH endonuclease [Komagataeibacter rhaeticus]ATU73679.1 HNH endonuclease [Komagataeibacter xylinus]QIP34488.1 HNH endonuclease [Komagataeibacter rhaeticus]QOC47005.1 HNH endonuclease [Komagataeibacter rhaeticus]